MPFSAEGLPSTPLGSIEAGEVDFNNSGDAVQPTYYDDGYLYVSPAADYVKVGSTTSVYIECNNAYLEESFSSDPEIADIDSSGVITGYSAGIVTITITAYIPESNDYCGYSFNVTVFEDVGLQSGETYFVHSHVSAHYLISQPSSGTMAAAIAPLTETEKASGGSNDSWQLVQHSDGKYSFCYGTKALTLSGVNVTYADYTGSHYQKFTVYRVNVGSHRGGYVIRYGNFYMGISSSNELKLLSFIPGSSVTGAGHFWSFINADPAEVNIVGFKYAENSSGTDWFDSTGAIPSFTAAYEDLGYTVYETENPSKETVKDDLQSSSAFVFRGHCAPGKLLFYTTGNDLDGIIVAHPSVDSYNYTISNFAANSMKNAELVMYIGCKSGMFSSSNYNLLIESYKKGAKLIVGTYDTVYTPESDAFLEAFADECQTGKTLQECLNNAALLAGGSADGSVRKRLKLLSSQQFSRGLLR